MTHKRLAADFSSRFLPFITATLGLMIVLLYYWHTLYHGNVSVRAVLIPATWTGLALALLFAWQGAGRTAVNPRVSEVNELRAALNSQRQLLALSAKLQQTFAHTGNLKELQEVLLDGLCACTGAGFAFITLADDFQEIQGVWSKGCGQPQLSTLQGENIHPELIRFIETLRIRSRVLLSDGSIAECLPDGWPALQSFAGIPIMRGEITQGLVLLGNPRDTDFTRESLRELDAVLAVYSHLSEIHHRNQIQQELEASLRANAAELAAQSERLKLSNQALENYAFMTSHDMQEPLRKIQMLGAILRRKSRGQMDEECQLYLNRLIYQSRKMQGMIADVLTLSSVGSKSQPFRKLAFEDLIPKVLQNLEPLIQENGAKIEIGQISPLWGDPAQICQLLENLVENAIKFRKPNIAPCILIYMNELSNGYAELIVEDNGLGFEERFSDRIFRIFERLHGKNHPKGGHGIGLAICKKITELHQGSIRAHSIPGKGSAFVVTLPMANRLRMQLAAPPAIKQQLRIQR